MSRFIVIALGLLFFDRPVTAETLVALTETDFKLTFLTNDGVQLTTDETNYYFNTARCQCETPIKIRVEPNNNTALSNLGNILASKAKVGTGRLYIASGGPDCLSKDVNARVGCVNLLSATDDPTTETDDSDTGGFTLSDLYKNKFITTPSIPISLLFGGTSKCTSLSTNRTIYLWLDADMDNVPDVLTGPKQQVVLDSDPPASPTLTEVKGGNEALNVTWSWATSTSDSTLKGFILFCSKLSDGGPGLPNQTSTPPYETSSLLCPAEGYDDPLKSYNPLYRCSGLIDATNTSATIRGLQNGVPYSVAVAAIDKSGNISAIATTLTGEPFRTVDFFTEYTKAGGAAEGCSMGYRPGSGGSALAWLAGLLPLGLLFRRRIKRFLGMFSILFVLFSAPTTQAQAVYHENAYNNATVESPWQGSPRNWAAEIRFGLYRPDVDSEFGGGPTAPYAFTFGTRRTAMWQFELDYLILKSFGTLGVGGQVGYFRNTGKACAEGHKSADGTSCTLRSADDTSLSLMPLSVLAVYRMDEMAKQWKVPFVPYVKVGLNYTLWTVRDGAGDVVKLDNDRSAQGWTPGWQAALGLSLQLDFLDPGSARAFDGDIGVNHTYAFFELTTVNGRGLWKNKVLRVGDSTWFAGLMFEF